MRIKDRDFKPFITEAELDGIVRRLAADISRDYQDSNLLACPILTGAYMFAADLLRRLTVPCEAVRYGLHLHRLRLARAGHPAQRHANDGAVGILRTFRATEGSELIDIVALI